jgi:hypothetical protein
MLNKLKQTAFFISVLIPNIALSNTLYFTPMIGYSMGGNVTNDDGEDYDVSSDLNYNFALEKAYDTGRIGLFYSEQASELETLSLGTRFRYLHFQSSIYYPIASNSSSYVGIGLGGTQLDLEWSEKEYYFSASLFGGFEQSLSKHVSLQAQARWNGTLHNSDSASVCNLPTTEESCKFYFSGDWLNQFQVNLGLVFKY